MQANLFQSEQAGAAETLVISYYPLAGNDSNTGPRYQREADITGFDILGVTRDGSDTTTKDAALRDNLSPERFETAWQEYAAGLSNFTDGYGTVIVRGESTGSFPALAVINTGLIRATHLAIVDGINLRTGRHGRPRSTPLARFDWAADAVKEAIHKPAAPDPTWRKPPPIPAEDGLKKFRTELYHWSRLWQSNYSADAALQIAEAQPGLAMLFNFLGHTATGSLKQVEAYTVALAEKYDKRRELHGELAANITMIIDHGAWHSFLTYPEYGASKLLLAKSMQSHVL